MEQVIARLGPSKITAKIQTGRFLQGNAQHPALDLTPTYFISSVEDPFEQYERLKKSNKTYNNAPKPTTLSQPSPPPPKQSPGSSVLPAAVSHCIIESDGYEEVSMAIGKTLACLALYLVDPKVSLLKADDASSVTDRFVQDACDNLEGEAQLYKKLGFSRKRSLTVQALRECLSGNDQALVACEEAVMYLSTLAKTRFVLFDPEACVRTEVGSPDHPVRLFVKTSAHPHRYKMFTNTDPRAVQTEIFRHITQKNQLPPNLDTLKANDVRTIVKALALECKPLKADMVAALAAFVASL